MPSPGTILEALDQDGRGMRVTFVWHRDRFAHNIAAIEGGRLVPLLASDEGSNWDDWPPSPVHQDLTIEDRTTERRVALLVGMAGTSHWSTSVEVDPDAMAVVFDVACHIKDRPLRLGSRYRIARSTRDVEFCVDDADEFNDVAVDKTDEAADFVVSVDRIVPPRTVRWRYQIARLSHG